MNNFTDNVYILTQQNKVYKQLLEAQALKSIKITEDKSEATILLAAPPMAAKQLDAFPKLQWLHSIYAGVDTLIQPHLRQDYTLTNVKGIFGQQISEYVLGYCIHYYRHLSIYQQQQSQQQWLTHPYGSLSSKTMLILGTGSIGAYLANTASHFGIHVIGVNRRGITPENSQFSKVYSIDELNIALSEADIVVNTLPKTQQTYELLDERSLSHCQNTVLFNVGRGDCVKEKGLLIALEQGWITHAYLDVFKSEPLTEHHPYWQHPNITLTPHIAAVSFPEQVIELFMANITRWQNKQPLKQQIDFKLGY